MPIEPMTAVFKHNGEVIDKGRGRITATRTYVVVGATSDVNALQASGVPEMGDDHPDGGDLEDITVQRYIVRPITDGVGAYDIDVIYSHDDFSLFIDPTQLSVRFDIGTTMQFIEVDLWGLTIGHDHLYDETGSDPVPPAGWPLVFDESHDPFGVDIFIPTFDFEVTMPIGTAVEPQLYFSLMSHVNGTTFNVGAWSFSKWYVQYMGHLADPLPITQSMPTQMYRIIHRFRAGAIAIPPLEHLSTWYQTGWSAPFGTPGRKPVWATWPPSGAYEHEVPLKFSIATQWKKVKVDNPDPNQPAVKKMPHSLSAQPIYVDGNLQELVEIGG